MAGTALRLLLAAAWAACAADPPGALAYIRRPASVGGETTPEMWMSAAELIAARGYPLEVHRVRTADGYLLTLQRIPGPGGALGGALGGARRGNRTGRGGRGGRGAHRHATPVLVGHGLASCSEQWVVRASDNLAFSLADSGFDVWLGNYRGSFYGRKHDRLSAKSRKFWDFSWHENGVYDQAAMIDYILAVTRRPALAVLGHSMSATTQVVLLAERPEYGRKVLANVLLAPPAFFGYPSGMMRLLDAMFRSHPVIKTAFSSLIVNDGMPSTMEPMLVFCSALNGGNLTTALPPYCGWFFEFGAGIANEPVDHRLRMEFLSHWPAGASIRQTLHYAQAIMAPGEFRKYDFGPLKNKMVYGSAKPPSYNLSRISSPMYIYYSQTDNLVSPRDVETLAARIPSLQRLHKMPYPEFNHADFLMSGVIGKDLNKHVLKDFNRHIPSYS